MDAWDLVEFADPIAAGPAPMGEAMAQIVARCAEAVPSSAWEPFAALDYDADLAGIVAWLDRLTAGQGIPLEVTGLWFGIRNYETAEFGDVAGCYVAGSAEYAADPDDWHCWHVWEPEDALVPSVALAAMLPLAREGGEACFEWADVGLTEAWARCMLHRLFRAIDAEPLLRGRPCLAVGNGHDEGGCEFVAEVRAGGLDVAAARTRPREAAGTPPLEPKRATSVARFAANWFQLSESAHQQGVRTLFDAEPARDGEPRPSWANLTAGRRLCNLPERYVVELLEPGVGVDWALTMDSVPIVSDRCATVLREHTGDDVQLVPATVQGDENPHHVVVIARSADCLDVEASGAQTRREVYGRGAGAEDIAALDALVIDPDRVPSDAQIFRVDRLNMYILVARQLAESFIAAGMTGCRFDPVA